MLGTIISSETKAQLQFENTFGFLVNDPSGISVGRGTVALNNLIPVADNKENKFNIGLYYTTEICCTFTSKYTKSVRQGLLRDLAGISFRFFDRFSVYAGAGFFRKGIFSDLAFKDIRKEVGASLQIPKHNLTLSSSYGVMKGLSLNVGYFVPVRPKSQESLKKGFPSLR
jgi:hypothetical protein